jgi:hypothetical protein
MRHPLPTVHIRTPLSGGPAQSSLGVRVTQSDGSEFPLELRNAKATINIDWKTGTPVAVDFQAVAGFDVELTAGVRYVTLNGIRYRLVRDDPQPAASGGEADSLPFQYFAENLDVRML